MKYLTSLRLQLVAALCFALPACGTVRNSTGAGDGGTADATTSDGPLGPPASDWCLRALPGASNDAAPLIALSRAHAAIRFFGSDGAQRKADRALAEVLESGAEQTPFGFVAAKDVIARYAAALPNVCAIAGNTSPGGEASVELRGDLAVVHPGSGTVQIPAQAKAIALDLREHRPGNDLAPLIASLIAGELNLPKERVRKHFGHRDEVWAPARGSDNIYGTTIETIEGPVLSGTAQRDLPLVLITGRQLSPQASYFAAVLRLEQRALLIGHDVFAAIAESRWIAVGKSGLLWRDRDLIRGVTRLPDRIAADLESDAPLDQISELDLSTPPAAISAAPASRAALSDSPLPARDTLPISVGRLRANLLMLHGALRLFFPYFPIVGDQIDQRLEQQFKLFERADAIGAQDMGRALGRMLNAIKDGHAFVGMPLQSNGTMPMLLPVRWENIAGLPTAYYSATSAVKKGDALIAVDGQSIQSLLANGEPLVSYTNPVTRDINLAYQLMLRDKPAVLTLRAPDGSERKETVEPLSYASLPTDFIAMWTERPSGWLGAPSDGIYYINLDGETSSGQAVLQAVEQARSARAVILDMRGYPWPQVRQASPQEAGLRWTAMLKMFGPTVVRPAYRLPEYTGYLGYQLTSSAEQFAGPPASESLSGELVLLIGPNAQSSAEDFALTLLASRRGKVTVIGRRSSGTDGNITGIQLLSDFTATFTGLEVRWPNGEVFHGRGIVPDIVVEPTAADIAAGRDTVLERAAARLSPGS